MFPNDFFTNIENEERRMDSDSNKALRIEQAPMQF